jgi:hypothetical protein
MSQQSEQQLASLYAGMSEGELEKVASEAYDLSDIARQALRLEIEKRELSIAINDSGPGYDQVELQDLVMLRRFRDLPEAMLAKGSLQSAGLECYLADDNIIRMDWFYSNLIGGIKLMVKPDDLEAANEILNQPVPEGIDYGAEGAFVQPKCPRCGSLDITFQELNKPLSYGSAWVGFPLPIASPKWKCENCEAIWADDEDASERNAAEEEKPQP